MRSESAALTVTTKPEVCRFQTYRLAIDHDGSEASFINAMAEFLRSCPEGTLSIVGLWKGKMITMSTEIPDGEWPRTETDLILVTRWT